MWHRLKASCFHSLTILWGYVLTVAGTAMSYVDVIGDALGDPNLRDQIGNAIGNPKVSARVLLFLGAVTILCRLRSIGKDKP
jgi:hypothetical protein